MIDTTRYEEVIVSKNADNLHLALDSEWPIWAEYKAIDENGELWFYEHKPEKSRDGDWRTKTGKSQQVRIYCHDWENSVIYRGIE